MIGVAFPVEPFGRARLSLVLANRHRRGRAQVPEHSQSAHPELGRSQAAVEVLCIEAGAIEDSHQAIHPVAGAMGSCVIVATAEASARSAQIPGRGLHGRIRERSLGPCAQSAQALRKAGRSLRSISLPNASADLLEVFIQRLGRPLAEFKEGLQETEDHGDVGKQMHPSALGRGPAIGIDRLGRIVRRPIPCRLGKHAISAMHPLLGRRVADRGPETAPRGGGGGDVDQCAPPNGSAFRRRPNRAPSAPPP